MLSSETQNLEATLALVEGKFQGEKKAEQGREIREIEEWKSRERMPSFILCIQSSSIQFK